MGGKQICDLAEANIGSRGLIEALDETASANRNTYEAIAITAAATGLTQTVKELVSHGCDVTARSDIFSHILKAAASSGSTELVSISTRQWCYDSNGNTQP